MQGCAGRGGWGPLNQSIQQPRPLQSTLYHSSRARGPVADIERDLHTDIEIDIDTDTDTDTDTDIDIDIGINIDIIKI